MGPMGPGGFGQNIFVRTKGNFNSQQIGQNSQQTGQTVQQIGQTVMKIGQNIAQFISLSIRMDNVYNHVYGCTIFLAI